MAIRLINEFKFKNLTWKSGHVYSFRYNAFRHDPHPTIILMYKVYGDHPNTGHRHNYIQGINFTYIPRSHRMLFGMQWQNAMIRTRGNATFSWDLLKRQFPYLRFGIRRYLLTPSYRIQDPIGIQIDDMEEAITDTWSKDFSKKVKIDMAQKYRRIQKNVKTQNKKTMFNIFGRRK